MTIEELARALYEPLVVDEKTLHITTFPISAKCSAANTLPFPDREGRESKNKLNPSPINNLLAFVN